MSYKTLLTSTLSPGVLSIKLNRPDVRNAFNEVLIQELGAAFKNEGMSSDVRVIVLEGEGKVFCAGGDLNWMKRSIDLSLPDNLKDTRALSNLFAFLNEFPKPVVGAIQGAAIGGGVGLVSICDIVVATENTIFSLSEVRLGIVPACIGPFVISKIGASHARELFLSAERFTAKKAKEIGLVHSVTTDAVGLRKKVQEISEQITECGPGALKLAKELVLNLSWPERRKQLPDCIEYISKTLAEARTSPEGQEGVRAFLEKREPSWITGTKKQ